MFRLKIAKNLFKVVMGLNLQPALLLFNPGVSVKTEEDENAIIAVSLLKS